MRLLTKLFFVTITLCAFVYVNAQAPNEELLRKLNEIKKNSDKQRDSILIAAQTHLNTADEKQQKQQASNSNSPSAALKPLDTTNQNLLIKSASGIDQTNNAILNSLQESQRQQQQIREERAISSGLYK